MRKLFLLLMIISLGSPTLAKDEVKWDSFDDCVDGASDHRRNKCDDEVGLDAVDCARSCLEGLEGQCEEYDYGTDDSSSDRPNEECEECQVLCEDVCDRFRQSSRRDNCLSECKSRCDDVCD